MARTQRHTIDFDDPRHVVVFGKQRHTIVFGGPGDLFEAAGGFCFLINGVDELLINATDCLLTAGDDVVVVQVLASINAAGDALLINGTDELEFA